MNLTARVAPIKFFRTNLTVRSLAVNVWLTANLIRHTVSTSWYSVSDVESVSVCACVVLVSGKVDGTVTTLSVVVEDWLRHV
ncbi:hypothetical protein Taro_047029 [Colocasia esculenta]|uniref:Uncharacterized protein n=1 Tax=Colocasia esculenta TaxID=4460 RepID=A0A843X395_COLES|nr:hypothetical protein [Colocasia esculenta]